MDIIRLLAIILLLLIVCYSVRENFTVHNYSDKGINLWTVKEGVSDLTTYVDGIDECEKKLLKKKNMYSAAFKIKEKKSIGKHECILSKKEAHLIVNKEEGGKSGYSVFSKQQGGKVYPLTMVSDMEQLNIISEMPEGNKGQRLCRDQCIKNPECTASVKILNKCILKKGKVERNNMILEGEVFLKAEELESDEEK